MPANEVLNTLDNTKGINVETLDVHAHSGKIVLSGNVADAAQAEVAIQAASGVRVGTSVENRLMVDQPR